MPVEHGLSGRELEVAREISRGATDADIARALVISETTVKTHVRHILAKLGVRSRHQVKDALERRNPG